MSNLNNKKIKICILEMSSQNKAILEFFFDNAGRSLFQEEKFSNAVAYIIDYDFPGAKENLEEMSSTSTMPGIIISIREVDLPNSVWIAKPLTTHALSSAKNLVSDLIASPPVVEAAIAKEPINKVLSSEALASTVKAAQENKLLATTASESNHSPDYPDERELTQKLATPKPSVTFIDTEEPAQAPRVSTNSVESNLDSDAKQEIDFLSSTETEFNTSAEPVEEALETNDSAELNTFEAPLIETNSESLIEGESESEIDDLLEKLIAGDAGKDDSLEQNDSPDVEESKEESEYLHVNAEVFEGQTLEATIDNDDIQSTIEPSSEDTTEELPSFDFLGDNIAHPVAKTDETLEDTTIIASIDAEQSETLTIHDNTSFSLDVNDSNREDFSSLDNIFDDQNAEPDQDLTTDDLDDDIIEKNVLNIDTVDTKDAVTTLPRVELDAIPSLDSDQVVEQDTPVQALNLEETILKHPISSHDEALKIEGSLDKDSSKKEHSESIIDDAIAELATEEALEIESNLDINNDLLADNLIDDIDLSLDLTQEELTIDDNPAKEHSESIIDDAIAELTTEEALEIESNLDINNDLLVDNLIDDIDLSLDLTQEELTLDDNPAKEHSESIIDDAIAELTTEEALEMESNLDISNDFLADNPIDDIDLNHDLNQEELTIDDNPAKEHSDSFIDNAIAELATVETFDVETNNAIDLPVEENDLLQSLDLKESPSESDKHEDQVVIENTVSPNEEVLTARDSAKPKEPSVDVELSAEEELQSLLDEIRHEAEGTSVQGSKNTLDGEKNGSRYLPTFAEERWSLTCGTNESHSNESNSNLGPYNSNDHMLSTLLNVVAKSKQTRQVMRLKLSDIIIVLLPELDTIYCDTSIYSNVYADMCVDIFDQESIKVHNLDTSEIRLYQKQSQEEPENTQSFEAFIWTTSLLSSRGRLSAGTDTKKLISLKYWPNITRLEKIPHGVQIAAVFYKHPGSLQDVPKWLNIDEKYVFAFYNAVLSLQIIELDNSNKRSLSSHRKKALKNTKNRGFFSRLLKRITT